MLRTSSETLPMYRLCHILIVNLILVWAIGCSAKQTNGPAPAGNVKGTITMDGKPVRVGSGPHVKATVTIYLKANNIERLQKYVDLWLKGMELAGTTRDRISSQRMQGQINRAAGKTSWSWDD